MKRTYRAVAYTMQGLVKYHGLRDWDLRLPYHDSISVNTTCLRTEASVTDAAGGGVFIEGRPSESANRRLQGVVSRLSPGAKVGDFRIDSRNVPSRKVKGVGYSSSAGAALTLLCASMLGSGKEDLTSLSTSARLFAASAARSLVGGFSRLYAGASDENTYAEKFADSKDMDLRMVIVPLPSRAKTEDAHREVTTSPFFAARVESAQRRCDEMERAITGNDLKALGTLAERDTMELHAVTMTGEGRMVLMTGDTLRVIGRVRALRQDGVEAYFSMQTGPSVFVNTSERDQPKVMRALQKLGYRCYVSGVGGPAELV